MPNPGTQNDSFFQTNDLDKLSNEEIAALLKGCGVRTPPPKTPPTPDVYVARLKS